ncbi:divalent-cation tolerance protein CutA [Luteimonas sp. RC10]|uniref:divalent-cation tolerance protein CutA n=1 Tax=Luteimonas sp. RC10 TaxID=2587035 RepID=UPI0016142EC3|nr:divalent-cation tolerance protein CutA [Luteimonas sp. RC10]MBB3345428.1 periplasmic divalent cation tolerance protein [Luteimonas sp. RC10]
MPVLTCLNTCPDNATAQHIARALVEARLAACVNLVPGVTSIYRWQGQVQSDAEVLLVIKTTADRLEALTERLRALHPYDTPALVALPVAGGLTDYLRWVDDETAPIETGEAD